MGARFGVLVLILAVLTAACTPAAPAPTAAPSKPAESKPTTASKPVAPAASPAVAAPAAPATAPAASPAAAAPAASPAAAAPAAATEDTLAEIKRRGEVNIFMEAQYAPYEFRDAAGELVGLDVDLARKIFGEALGVKVNLTDIDFSGLLASVISRKADLTISGITITKERAERFDFSIPYSEAGAAILVRLDDTTINGPDDLNGKVIGTQIGSSSQKTAQAHDEELKQAGKPGYADLKTYERFPIAHEDLLARRLDAVVQGKPPLQLLLKERPNRFRIVSTLGPKAYYGVAVRKADRALLEFVNSELRKYKQDGTLKALQEKWLGVSEVETLPDPWTPLS